MQTKGRPITPAEASESGAHIPPEVFDVFNNILVELIPNASFIIILESHVVKKIEEKLGCKRYEIFDKHWLDVEEAYRKAGWTVVYDKPGDLDNYEAYYKFSKNTK
jgi:hypothetical protein